MSIKLTIAFMLVANVAGGLVEVLPTRSSQACCRDSTLRSCQEALVDPSVLLTREPLTLAGISLHFTSTIEPHGHVYKSAAGDEAIITYNQETGAVFGTLKTVTGDSFALEKCSLGFAWKEFSVDSFEADTAVLLDLPEDSTTGVLQAKAAADNVTAASYSVMFYYTPEFADITADIDGFIDQVLAETNQAYVQSGVPLTATKFCTERATIHDASGTGSSQLISAFRGMKASVAELRNTADSAVLLATDFSSCGVAYLNTIGSGNTISVCKKNCCLGYYSFGHELGHNMGLTHNKEVASNNYYPMGHGHLVAGGQAPLATTGVRTILGYSASGHRTRVNYYSNPSLTYQATGTPLGVVGEANNAAVLLANRLAMAAVGDETATCSGTSTSGATSTSAPTTTPPTIAGCLKVNAIPTMKPFGKKIKKVKDADACQKKCENEASCSYFKFKDHKQLKRRVCQLMQIKYNAKTTWTSGPKKCQ